jgi:hypothetical protein
MLGQVAIRKSVTEGHCHDQESADQLGRTGKRNFSPPTSGTDSKTQRKTENGFIHGFPFSVTGAVVTSGFLGKTKSVAK